jgi:hypothetical protein
MKFSTKSLLIITAFVALGLGAYKLAWNLRSQRSEPNLLRLVCKEIVADSETAKLNFGGLERGFQGDEHFHLAMRDRKNRLIPVPHEIALQIGSDSVIAFDNLTRRGKKDIVCCIDSIEWNSWNDTTIHFHTYDAMLAGGVFARKRFHCASGTWGIVESSIEWKDSGNP